MKTSQPKELSNVVLLLKCPGIHNAPTVVTSIVEDALIDVLVNGEEVHDWEKATFHNYALHKRLFADDGEIILAASGEELWDFYKDPMGGAMRYQEQVDELMEKFVDLNQATIQAFYDVYVPHDIQVMRAFRNQWMLSAQVTHINQYRPNLKPISPA